MPQNNISLLYQQTLDTNIIEFANRAQKSLQIFIPLATASICWLNSSQVALAIDINTHVKTDTTNQVALTNFHPREDYEHTQELNGLHHNHASGFLPRILNMLGSPFLAHLNRFSQNENQKQIFQSTLSLSAPVPMAVSKTCVQPQLLPRVPVLPEVSPR